MSRPRHSLVSKKFSLNLARIAALWAVLFVLVAGVVKGAETPPVGTARLKPPSAWEQHPWYVVGGITIIALQGVLIVGFIVLRARRRRAQDALRESQERLRLLLETTNAIPWEADARTWRFTYVGPQAVKLLGYTPDRWRDEDFWTSHLHPDDREYAIEFCLKSSSSLKDYEFEYRMIAADGGAVWIHDVVNVVRINGEPETLRGFMVDITERKQMEARLRQERAFLRQVIDIDPNFIFAKDREGRFTLVNQAVADAYGTTVENLIGKTDADFNPNAEEVEAFRRMDLEVMDTLRERIIPEEHITDSKGKVRWLQTVKRPIIGKDGTANQVLGSATDITNRRESEVEATRQRAELAHIARVSTMGELAASMAHELNQPLGAILSNAEAAEMFLNQHPPALNEVREILVDIRKDDQRAGDVIQRMRAWLGKREMEFQPVEINEVVRDVLRMVGADAMLRKTAISSDLAASPAMINGDRVHLQQVLLNLILNGMEAMATVPEGQRQLIVRTGNGNNGTVKIAVSDSGPGIPADKLPKLFEPFFTTKNEGLGMGLAISQRIIEAHGGRIWAENNPNGGATFSFTLPVEERVEGRV